jgi:hypothetical protein
MLLAYESIIQVIKDRTENTENKSIDYYEAVRIAYTESEYMKKYLDETIRDVKEINKTFKTNMGVYTKNIRWRRRKG